MGLTEWEGSADERWRPADASAVQVDDQSTTGQERGRKKRVLREREATSTGKILGEIGDRYEGGRNGMDDPENGRRNCGEDGPE